MSRCFPFPPPGYEKKARTDEVDLLKKEKEREKKHKKEKKDKEKKEGKDKREREKSDGKHKEKKDKKEKDRDKKKDKDRDKYKDKGSNLDGKRFPVQSEGSYGEKVSTENKLPGRSEGHKGERVSNEKRFALQSEGHGGEKFAPKEEKDKHRNNLSNEKRSIGQVSGYNGVVSRSIPLAQNSEDSKFVQELERRVSEEGRGIRNDYVDKFNGVDQKRNEGMLKLLAKHTGNEAGGNGKNDKRGDDRTIDGRGIRPDTGFSGNSLGQNLAEVVQTRVEGVATPLEKKIERKIEGNEKTKEKGGDDKRRDKRKDKEREKKRQDKDRDKDKERKKERAKEKKENKTMEQDEVKESINNDIIGTHDVKAPNLSEDSNKSAATEGNLRKRKDLETNGFLHANESRPTKLPRHNSSTHSLLKNGRILEPCQTSIPSDSDKQGPTTNLKVDSKVRKVNGNIEAQPLPISFTESTFETALVDQIAEVSRKPPHPDSKLLSQILSVPKIEESSNFDEQDWLFSSTDILRKRSKVEPFRDKETPLVWSDGLRIESADVYALPYVIPY